MRKRIRRYGGPLALLILRFATCDITAQLVGVDPAYPAGDGPNSVVRTIALQPDGRVLIGGLFTNVNGLPRPYFARLNVDGTLDQSFSPQLNLDPRGIFPRLDGRIFISGSFTNVNGTARFNLAMLNSDGSLDTNFEPALPSRSYDTLTGVPSADGSVWVTGSFTNLGGLPRNRFARLLANGSVDAACPSPFAATNSLAVAAVQPDGKVVVAGNFHAVAGAPMEGVVRLNPDGSVDSSFQSGLAPTNRLVRAVLQADGRLVAAITTQAMDGVFVGPQRLIRLNADGSIDAAYHVDFSFVGFPFSSGFFALRLQPDGRLLVAGTFLRANGTPRASIARIQPDGTLDYCFDVPFAAGTIPLALDAAADGAVTVGGSFGGIGGQWRPHLARLIPPAGCDPGVVEFAVPAVHAGEDALRAVVPIVRRGGADREQTVEFATRDGSALAGQDYEGTNGTLRFAPGERSRFISVPLQRDFLPEGGETFQVVLSAPGNGAVLGAQTNVAVTINDAAPGTAGAPDTNYVVQLDGPVTALIPVDDGRVVLGGAFTNVNGRLSPSLARLLADGSFDTGFVRTQSLDGDVISLALQSDGRLLAAGRFRNVDGIWRPGLARFNQDGSADASFAPFASWPTNSGYSVEMEKVIVLPDGSVVCGGLVPLAGYGYAGALFKLSPGGAVDAAFTNRFPLGVGVGALTPGAGGKFYLGIDSSSFRFGSSLVRVSPDGALDLNFVPPADYQVGYYDTPPCVLPDGRVVVAGSSSAFTGLPDQPPMWRLNLDGSLDSSFSIFKGDSFLGLFYRVVKFSVSADGRVLVAGDFSYASPGLARANADGSQDLSFYQGKGLFGRATGAPPYINALTALPQGGWLMGGDFGGYDGFAQRYLVKILPESLVRPLEFQFALTNLTVSETNSSVTLEVRRFGDASGDASVTVRTEDGSATAAQDYSPLDSTIHFAPGQWSQTVTVAILNDQVVETAEQFSVVLTNATAGFSVGQPSTVRLQITSDDAGVEFVADTFHGIEEEGFPLAGVRWTGSVSSASNVLVNLVPETGSTNALVTTSVLVTQSRYPFPSSGTNWFRIGIVDNAQHEATRRFRLELVPQANLVPGPRSNAALLIDDLDFAAAPSRGVAGVVEAIASSPDGGVYLGGDFTGVHGVPRNRLARLRPNGEVDTAFNPGRGPNGNVTALAVAGDGKLVIGGDFSEVNGVPRARVARLDANGALDVTFDPGAGPTRTNGVPFIRALCAETNGSVLVGGAFTHFNGLSRRLLARLHPDGGVDTGFTSPFLEYSPFSVPRVPDSTVIHSLLILPDGSRLAAGWMYYSAGVGPVSVVRLTPTGQIDPLFRKITWNSLGQVAWSTAVAPNGTIVVGGRGARSSGTTINTNWIAIRRFTSNGLADTVFTVTNSPQISFFASEVRQLLVQPDGAIVFAAVIFSGRDGTEIHRAILGRLQAGGAWDADFGLVDIGLPLINVAGSFWFRLNQPSIDEPPVPTALFARQPDGVLVLAGAFDSVNGEPRRRLARLEADGDLRGVLRLDFGFGFGVTPALTGPGEVEIPYVVESSLDLQSWTPWRTNALPWQGWSEAIQMGDDRRFFRAVGP